MTNKEAAKILKSAQTDRYIGNPEPLIDAWNMAIKALEQEPILDKIKAEIKGWYWQADKQALAKDPCVVDAMIDLFIRTIDKYKAESEGKE
jgi:hypothetical protein